MQTPIPGNNPFAILTAIVAPAILTNASSVLALGTSNRLARVVDRTRVVASDLAGLSKDSPMYTEWLAQMHALELRAEMLVKALRLFYAALGLFATSALITAGGSIGTYYGQKLLFELGAALAIITGTSAVAGLGVGCYLMINETRLAVKSLGDEARMRIKYHDTSKTD